MSRHLLAAWEELATSLGRTAISVVTVLVGVAALTVTVTALTAARADIREVVERQFGLSATIEATFTATGLTEDQRAAVAYPIDNDPTVMTSRVEEIMTIARSGPGGSPQGATLQLVDKELFNIRRIPMTDGRWLNHRDGSAPAPRVVLTTALLGRLGLSGSPVGTTVMVGRRRALAAVVVGVALSAPGQDEPLMFALAGQYPGTTWSGVAEDPVGERGTRPTQRLLMRVPEDRSALAIAVLNRNLDRMTMGNDFSARRVDSSFAFRRVLDQQGRVLLLVSALMLAVGGMALMNISIATVRQRTHEFGVRRAYGARRLDIFGTVLLESIMTTVVAGLGGVMLANVSVGAVRKLLDVPVDVGAPSGVPAGTAALAIGIAMLIGLLAGVVPAIRATRISVVAALRN